MSAQQSLVKTVGMAVGAMHYELVDVEKSAGGLLRVTIDRRPGQSYPSGPSEAVTVDDCEAVTRHLQYALEAGGVDYSRLEVSSPGLDRPLKNEADCQRFAGAEVQITLKQPFKGRKNYRGLLAPREGGWRLEMPPAPPPARKGAPARKTAGKAAPAAAEPELALDFTWDEVREARLVPVIDFKGRKAAMTDAAPGADVESAVAGDQTR